ncbi:MAG: hypothetical protein HOB73_08800 [Planctomycetaceae bacterium]|jgi:hypothetical protein|nr:hypothetical protein [Planctomycetaceae bacterium]MBT5126512.1 hypothetical protein [Planctomycetaceae bacterium]
MKIIGEYLVILFVCVAISNQQLMAQRWEPATSTQIELAKNLHQWLKSGNQKAILDRYLQPAELSKLVKKQEDNLAPDLLIDVLKLIGDVPIKKGDETVNHILGGGKKMVDWSRVYLKYVWQESLVKTAALDLDMIMIQFSHGAAKVWLQVSVARVEGSLHLCLLNGWRITRDGVINLPIPNSSKDLSKYEALRRSMELVIDLARFPNPISKADDKIPAGARAAVTAFERATSAEELGRHVFNCCVARDFNAAGKALVPASVNTGTEGLSAGQFEVLAALDLEKLYANTMVYWGFHWQDCVIEAVTEKNRRIIVTFNTVIQLKDGKMRKAQLEFAIDGSKQIDGVWYLSTSPEYPTGISRVTMQGVTLDVSGLVEVSGRLTLDGNPLANAVISMTPWTPMARNGKAERGLNSRVPSGRTNEKGEFTMTVIYSSASGMPVLFSKIATNKYVVGVFDGAPMDSKDSTLELPLADPVDTKSDRGTKAVVPKRVPQVFANPFGIKGDGKYLTVDKPLTSVLIELNRDGKMKVIALSP